MASPSLECRSFWRAGSYDVSSSVSSTTFLAPLESSDFDRARVHPKFLHSNATSHKWAFGAIAELIDNAVDEIHNGASFILVDTINNPRDNSPMLLFQDDGGGMDPEGIRRCMSLGFSNKRSKSTIGQYGNGFKTSTMRLGADAIVFSSATRGSRVTYCIGLLSYTYLRREMKDDIIVPMVDFEILDGQVTPLTYNSQDDWDESMNIILEWSPFSSSEELMKQFEDLGSHGTKVLIYNLWMNDDGLLELDFDDNDEDILLRDQASSIMTISKAHKEIIQSHISNTLRFSLRAYGSVLYLRKFTNFQIILRGKPIQQVRIADELKFSKNVSYKPQMGAGMEDVSVRTTIGFAKEAPMLGIFGINVYHKNRLILPFWKVFQEGSSRGRCVVGVVEANFIEPAHDKQDFERTPLFIRLETKLRQIIVDYWKTHCHLIGYQSTNPEIRNKQKLDKQVINAGQRVKHVTAVVPQARPSVLQDENDSDDDISELLSSQTHVQHYVMEPSKTTDGVDSIDMLDSTSIEKLSEENIQLFARREELKQRELQLKQTIEELEHQIVQAKRKCNRLSGQIEFRQNVITHLD